MIILKDKISKLSKNLSQIDEIKGRSLWHDAKIRFLKNKAALISLITLLLVLLFSFIGSVFAVWSNEEIDWSVLGDISTILIIILSILPPKYPAIAPYIVPTITAIKAPIIPTIKEIFVPWITLE